MLLQEGDHLHLRLQGQAPHYHHVLIGLGRIALSLGERHLRSAQIHVRRQGERRIQLVPRIPQGQGWDDGNRRGADCEGKKHIPMVHECVLLQCDLRKTHGMGVKMSMNKDVWRLSTVFSILSNEKYKGDAPL